MTVHISAVNAAPVVLNFWFGEIGPKGWFSKAPDVDSECARRFGGLRDVVLAGKAEAWRDIPDHLLAAIILLDQFSRNIYRGSAKAFEGDALARELTYLGLTRGWDQHMTADERQFLLMPLMHSENIVDQEQSLIEFGKQGGQNLHFAKAHHAQIARFGRFPGRNAVLGRVSSDEEQALIESGKTF